KVPCHLWGHSMLRCHYWGQKQVVRIAHASSVCASKLRTKSTIYRIPLTRWMKYMVKALSCVHKLLLWFFLSLSKKVLSWAIQTHDTQHLAYCGFSASSRALCSATTSVGARRS